MVALDERRLLSRHVAGDPTAFEELLGLYRAPVYGYLVRCGVSDSAREDLFQEIFVRVHESAERYQAERPLKPWLFTIVANSVRSWYRKKKVEALVFEDDPPPVPVEPLAHAELEGREVAAWLSEAIAALGMMQRQAVVLVCIEGIEQQQVAEILEVPLNTLKTHLRRGRLALTSALMRRKVRIRRESSS